MTISEIIEGVKNLREGGKNEVSYQLDPTRKLEISVIDYTDEDKTLCFAYIRVNPENNSTWIVEHEMESAYDASDDDIEDAILSVVPREYLDFDKNTMFVYQYRDASNYKKQSSVVVKGELSFDQIDRIMSACEYDGETYRFIAGQVGLPENRFEKITEDDHCWFELEEIHVSSFKVNYTDVTAEGVYKAFLEAGRDGWNDVFYAPVPDYDEEEEDIWA